MSASDGLALGVRLSGPPRRGLPAGVLAAVLLLPLLAAAAGSVAADQSPYARWWGTWRGWEALWRTVRLASLAAVVALVLAWALAASAVRCSRALAWPVALISALPMLVPSSALATTWTVALAPQTLVGGALARAGLSVYSLPAAAAVLALRYFGIAVAVFTHEQLRQCAYRPVERAFGISGAAAIVHLRLRPAARAAAVAGVIVMLFCMNDHIIPGMLLISTYGTQVMIQYSALLDPPGAVALAVPAAGVGAAMGALALWVGRGGWSATEPPPGECGPAGPRWRRWVAGGVTAAVLGVALAVPVVVLAWRAETCGALFGALADARRQLGQTLYCTALGALASAALGAVLGGHWARCRRAGRLTAAPLVLLNLAVPATLLAIGVMELTRRLPLSGLADSSWPLLAGYVARFAPVATLAFYAVWRDEPAGQDLAARVHGVGRWRLAARVSWPRRRAVLMAVTVLCGLLIVTELETSILLAPAGKATLGIRLYTLIHTAPDAMVSALTLGILALLAPGIVLLLLLVRAGGK